jgi:hypothetical protein
MDEVNIRVANFIKFFSMMMVIGSLLYMYAYSSDRLNFLNESQDWISDVPKSSIFYAGLGLFALFNITMHIGINMYKNVEGIDERSVFFKSKYQKEKLLIWFTSILAGVNVFITSIVLYLAMLKINEASVDSDFVYIPFVGMIILIAPFVGLIAALIRK